MKTINYSQEEIQETKNIGNPMACRKYYLVMWGVLFFGFFINAIEVLMLRNVSWGGISEGVLLFVMIAYIVSATAGIIINRKSHKPLFSFLGYCLVILPLGVMLSILLYGVDTSLVSNAFIVTALLSAIMCLLSFLMPNVFCRMAGILSICLLVVVIFEIFAMFLMPSVFHGTILDWIVALIFCGYIGVDLSRSVKYVNNLDSAIDAACGLYLDIINLFIRILSILAKSNKK